MGLKETRLVNVEITESLHRKKSPSAEGCDAGTRAAHGVIEIEEPTIWQCLAPHELVVQPKYGAIRVRAVSGDGRDRPLNYRLCHVQSKALPIRIKPAHRPIQIPSAPHPK